MIEAVKTRAGGSCEICGGSEACQLSEVGPNPDALPERALMACEACRDGLETPSDIPHARCLAEAVWSEVPAVQVAAWRALRQIEASWASALLDQVWMDEETLAWATANDAEANRPSTLDSNGVELRDGDNVTLIKDLSVKGANFTAKRGTLVKGIRLNDDPGLVEGRVNRVAIFLKTEFLKKA